MALRKQKQKQKQKQSQNVIVNIHEKKVAKKRRPHRKKIQEQLPLPPPVILGLPKVPPIVVQYSEPASLTAPIPPPAPEPKAPALSSMFKEPVKESFKTPARVGSSITELIAPSPASTISSVTEWIEPVAEAPKRVPISKDIPIRGSAFFSPIRPSSDILREAPPSLEEIIGSPTSSQEELSGIFGKSPVTATPKESIIQAPSIELSPIQQPSSGIFGGAVSGGGGLVSSRVADIEKNISSSNAERTKQARQIRTALQLSQRTGSDVTDAELLSGFYGNIPSGRRRVPTTEQKDRLEKLGKPYNK